MTATPVMKGQQHLFEKPPRVLKQPRKAVLYAQIAELTNETIRLRARIEWLELPWYWRAWIRAKRIWKIVFPPPFVREVPPHAHPGD